MTDLVALLRTFFWQELRHYPWRYWAALASIALGVALAFSVHLINAQGGSDGFANPLRDSTANPAAHSFTVTTQ
jgi:putative ABC transport system permease protein